MEKVCVGELGSPRRPPAPVEQGGLQTDHPLPEGPRQQRGCLRDLNGGKRDLEQRRAEDEHRERSGQPGPAAGTEVLCKPGVWSVKSFRKLGNIAQTMEVASGPGIIAKRCGLRQDALTNLDVEIGQIYWILIALMS